MPSWTDPNLNKSADVRALYDWWLGACGVRRVPDRRDFDPIQHRGWLPTMLISEAVGNPVRIRYRLVGTKVVAIAGFDFTGHYLDELLGEKPREPWLDFYSKATETQMPVLGGVTEPTVSGNVFYYEFAICPVTAGGERVQQFICIEDYFGFSLTSAGLRPWLRGR
jgi:hypothetical protein